jgi:hypothetical protein
MCNLLLCFAVYRTPLGIAAKKLFDSSQAIHDGMDEIIARAKLLKH